MSKVCKCGGIMNFDPYFKANVCNSCGRMERISRSANIMKCEVVQSDSMIGTKMEAIHFTSNSGIAGRYVTLNKMN